MNETDNKTENYHLPKNKQLKGFAKTMRKNPTDEESRLWYGLLRYITPKFHRQKIIGNYIADFYCPKLKIIIEVDGSQHYEEKQLIYDAIRTEYLEEFGYEVTRIPNYIVNKEFKGLTNYLIEYCQKKCKGFDLEFSCNPERNPRNKFK